MVIHRGGPSPSKGSEKFELREREDQEWNFQMIFYISAFSGKNKVIVFTFWVKQYFALETQKQNLYALVKENFSKIPSTIFHSEQIATICVHSFNSK